MITMFRESGTFQGMAPQALALYAAVNAVFYNRKTLVLQFNRESPVDKVLRGQQDSEEELGHGRYGFDDTGIDALMRRIETKRFEKEHFDIACRHLSKTENLLDVAGVSKKEDFAREILMKEESVGRVLKEARKIYDDIFLLGDGADAAQMSMLNKKVDLSMICVAQGRQEEIVEPESVKSDGAINEVLYLVTDFDNRSAFDVATMKKAYGVKKIAVLPYNTGFKDAFNSQNVLGFVMNNTKVLPHDVNYDIISAVMSVEKVMMGQEIEDTPFIDLDRLNRVEGQDEPEEEPEMRTLTAENVRYTKRYTGHLWWKKEVDDYEVTEDHFEDEDVEPETAPEDPELKAESNESGEKEESHEAIETEAGYEDDEGYVEEDPADEEDWDDGEYVTEEPEEGNDDFAEENGWPYDDQNDEDQDEEKDLVEADETPADDDDEEDWDDMSEEEAMDTGGLDELEKMLGTDKDSEEEDEPKKKKSRLGFFRKGGKK